MANFVDLGQAENPPLAGHRNWLWQVLWHLISATIFEGSFHFPYCAKAAILRAFGADVGNGLVIKPRVRIKYPWFLTLGNNVWLGESVWIDNLCRVNLGSNVCISQCAYLFTGNHNYKSARFTRFVRAIDVHDEAWIGARCVIGPGSRIEQGVVMSAGSVFSGDTKVGAIYSGNPASFRRFREIAIT